jgi:hypothetical protein
MNFLAWLEQTEFSTWLRESDWGYPNVLCVHAVGMGMVVGVSLMYCARVLGFARAFPLEGFHKLFALAWVGFVLNAVSGVLLFIGEPRRLADTPAFWIKMILIVFAGLALWALAKTMEALEDDGIHDFPAPDGTLTVDAAIPAGAKTAAVFSIFFWLAAITAGRIIGYTIPPPPL